MELMGIVFKDMVIGARNLGFDPRAGWFGQRAANARLRCRPPVHHSKLDECS